MSRLPAPHPDAVAAYTQNGWWGSLSVADHVRARARNHPGKVAFVSEGRRMTWAEYDAGIDALAQVLAAVLAPGEVFGVLLPDAPEFHIALCAAERSGTIALGMGARSGPAEIHHLMSRSGARVLLTRSAHRGRAAGEIVGDLAREGWEVSHLIEVAPDAAPAAYRCDADGLLSSQPAASFVDLSARATGPNELSMLNSTSGTTGRPKLVMQFANRWLRFSELAIAGADLTSDDIMFGAVPGPFGFGLWTAHYAPALLGMTTVLMERFDAAEMLRLLATERVTVLACVSTQFKMLLDCPELAEEDPRLALRAMFTGGEAVSYERAREFEERVGASVLQFYGSNESGSISYTTLRDPQERRLRTAGRVGDDVEVRLFDTEGDVTAAGRGRPGVVSPTIGIGYYQDDAANAELFRDGYLLMPDLVEIDDDGWLQVVGRISDLIIRGGKNISAVEVEEAVEAHPDVLMAAAVPVPDAVYGERIGVALCQVPGVALDVAALTGFLLSRGVSKHLLPERVAVVDDLPRAAGEKIAKGQVRELFAATDAVDRDLRAHPAGGGRVAAGAVEGLV